MSISSCSDALKAALILYGQGVSLACAGGKQEPLRKALLQLTRQLQLQLLADSEAFSADLVVDLQMATDRAFGAGMSHVDFRHRSL